MDEEAKKAEKKRKQREAWLKWYRSPKGEAYRQKDKERRALKGQT